MVKKGRARTRARKTAHHYYSKMAFDGKRIVSETQKDDEPVRRRVYTLKQLNREIPIAGELVKKHLGGVVPRTLSYPISRKVAFRSVLPSPADIGLLPPREMSHNHHNHNHHNHNNHNNHNNNTRRRRPSDDDVNMRLVVEDNDIFDLP
jgi:hypothetical protein